MGTVRGSGSVDDETPTGRQILHRLRDRSLTRAEQQDALDEACRWLRASGGTDGRSGAGYGDILHTILTGVRVSVAEGGFQGLVVDLSGMHIEDLDLAGLLFESGELRLEDCSFSGSCSFVGAELAGGLVSFAGSTFAGRGNSSAARFDDVAVTGAEVCFDRTSFVGGTPGFQLVRCTQGSMTFTGAELVDTTLDFYRLQVTGGRVSFDGVRMVHSGINARRAEMKGGSLSFAAAHLGGDVHLDGLVLAGGEVSFRDASVHGLLSLRDTAVRDGTVSFRRARIDGVRIDLEGLVLEAGALDFSDAVVLSGVLGLRRVRLVGGRVDLTRCVVDGEGRIELPGVDLHGSPGGTFVRPPLPEAGSFRETTAEIAAGVMVIGEG